MYSLKHIDTNSYIKRIESIKNKIFSEFSYNLDKSITFKDDLIYQNFTLLARNSFILSTYQTLEFKLMNVLLLCEYDKGNVNLEIHNDHFSTLDSHLLIFNNTVDSLITSLDILSKIISWYYDLECKNKANFNKYFLKCMKSVESLELNSIINDIEKNDSLAKIKDYRHNDKHSNALGKRIESSEDSISVSIKHYGYEVDSIKQHINDCLDFVFNSVEKLSKIILKEGANKVNKSDIIGYTKK